MIKYFKVKLGFSGKIELYRCEKDFDFKFKQSYVVETRYGHDIGLILPNSISLKEKLNNTLPEYQILKPAEADDFENLEECKRQATEAFPVMKNKIEHHRLPMKLISIHFFLDRNKILFNFTAEGRVDFRDLVKDLASTFKTRIELRQIGVRDESMVLGGYGVCGREFCCTRNQSHGDPISIKMAKDQNLTLNSVKISGVCGRLMCCLDYELDRNTDEKSGTNSSCGCKEADCSKKKKSVVAS